MATKKIVKEVTKDKKSDVKKTAKSTLKDKSPKDVVKSKVKKKEEKPATKVDSKKTAVKKAVKPAVKDKTPKKAVESKIKKEKPVSKADIKKTESKKSAPAKVKKVEENKKTAKAIKNIKADKNPKLKESSKKEVVSEKNNLKKAPNQSLETILPEDKKEQKPKVLAKPPVRRDLAPKPIAVNIKKQDVEKTNYSQAELEEFKGIINKKLAEARRDFDLLKESLSNKDNGTEDTSPTFKLLEDGSDVLSKEELAQLAARQQKFITNLENALIRIENKTYGVCRITGKLISPERLRVVPHATTSIEGKMAQ